jgi:flagellin-specific chaperone FliS
VFEKDISSKLERETKIKEKQVSKKMAQITSSQNIKQSLNDELNTKEGSKLLEKMGD